MFELFSFGQKRRGPGRPRKAGRPKKSKTHKRRGPKRTHSKYRGKSRLGMAISCRKGKKSKKSCYSNPSCSWRKKVGCVRKRGVLKSKKTGGAVYLGPSGPEFY